MVHPFLSANYWIRRHGFETIDGLGKICIIWRQVEPDVTRPVQLLVSKALIKSHKSLESWASLGRMIQFTSTSCIQQHPFCGNWNIFIMESYIGRGSSRPPWGPFSNSWSVPSRSGGAVEMMRICRRQPPVHQINFHGSHWFPFVSIELAILGWGMPLEFQTLCWFEPGLERSALGEE